MKGREGVAGRDVSVVEGAPLPGDMAAGDRIRMLQKQLTDAMVCHRAELRSGLVAARARCVEAQDLPYAAGEKEEYRSIAAALDASLERLAALDGRN